jgi:hypothetical protein
MQESRQSWLAATQQSLLQQQAAAQQSLMQQQQQRRHSTQLFMCQGCVSLPTGSMSKPAYIS